MLHENEDFNVRRSSRRKNYVDTPKSNKDLPKGQCTHVNTHVSKKACHTTITQPDHWCCQQCETSDSIRLCLKCGICYCKTHIAAHCQKEKHYIILQMNAIFKNELIR